ncbi:MAG: hypothetical protein MJ152_01610 [Clostridia bacterium]|nr:hypothetical protein [Clostridia bacterium]
MIEKDKGILSLNIDAIKPVKGEKVAFTNFTNPETQSTKLKEVISYLYYNGESFASTDLLKIRKLIMGSLIECRKKNVKLVCPEDEAKEIVDYYFLDGIKEDMPSYNKSNVITPKLSWGSRHPHWKNFFKKVLPTAAVGGILAGGITYALKDSPVGPGVSGSGFSVWSNVINYSLIGFAAGAVTAKAIDVGTRLHYRIHYTSVSKNLKKIAECDEITDEVIKTLPIDKLLEKIAATQNKMFAAKGIFGAIGNYFRNKINRNRLHSVYSFVGRYAEKIGTNDSEIIEYIKQRVGELNTESLFEVLNILNTKNKHKKQFSGDIYAAAEISRRDKKDVPMLQRLYKNNICDIITAALFTEPKDAGIDLEVGPVVVEEKRVIERKIEAEKRVEDYTPEFVNPEVDGTYVITPETSKKPEEPTPAPVEPEVIEGEPKDDALEDVTPEEVEEKPEIAEVVGPKHRIIEQMIKQLKNNNVRATAIFEDGTKYVKNTRIDGNLEMANAIAAAIIEEVMDDPDKYYELATNSEKTSD